MAEIEMPVHTDRPRRLGLADQSRTPTRVRDRSADLAVEIVEGRDVGVNKRLVRHTRPAADRGCRAAVVRPLVSDDLGLAQVLMLA
jgi:hypothetical protein